MFKKSITFHDLDGNKITEDFYFHLTKAEVTELELSEKGGLTGYLQAIVKEEDAKELIAKFKEIILMTVGRRSEDGRRFIKNQEIRDDFMQTEAYSELFMELATDADAATAFMTALIPAGLENQVKQEIESNKTEDVQLPPSSPSDIFREKMKDPNWIPTEKDLVGIDLDLFAEAWRRKASKSNSE